MTANISINNIHNHSLRWLALTEISQDGDYFISQEEIDHFVDGDATKAAELDALLRGSDTQVVAGYLTNFAEYAGNGYVVLKIAKSSTVSAGAIASGGLLLVGESVLEEGALDWNENQFTPLDLRAWDVGYKTLENAAGTLGMLAGLFLYVKFGPKFPIYHPNPIIDKTIIQMDNTGFLGSILATATLFEEFTHWALTYTDPAPKKL